MLNTPLTPYMGEDWLSCRHLHVSGSALEGTAAGSESVAGSGSGSAAGGGFRYQHPLLTEELFREMLQHAIASGTFPKSCYVE